MSDPTKRRFDAACNAHSNLNMWGAVIALLEGGLFYEARTHKPIGRVIAIAKAEMQKELTHLDAATGRKS